MTWKLFPELPPVSEPHAWQIELAKLEALRAIADELEELTAAVRPRVLSSTLTSAPAPRPGFLAGELAALVDQLQAIDTRHCPYHVPQALAAVVTRLRELAGAVLS